MSRSPEKSTNNKQGLVESHTLSDQSFSGLQLLLEVEEYLLDLLLLWEGPEVCLLQRNMIPQPK